MTQQPFDPPTRDRGDRAHALVKAAISGVPVVGGPGAEFFAYLVTPPLEQRRHSWAEEVGQALRDLTQRIGGLEQKLISSETFPDVALHAAQAASRTSSTAKREALQNAVLNSALQNSPDAEVDHLFIRLIDELSPQQVQLLLLFDNPAHWFQNRNQKLPGVSMGALSHVVEGAFPELKGRRSLYDQLWRDLYGRGLVNTESLHTMMTTSGLGSQRTTDLGREFLSFISEPPR